MVTIVSAGSCHCTSKLQFSEYGNLFLGLYPPNKNGVAPWISAAWFGTSACTLERLLGGGGGGVVPNGFVKVSLEVDSTGTTNGGSKVTPKGPLKPNPALGEYSVRTVRGRRTYRSWREKQYS